MSDRGRGGVGELARVILTATRQVRILGLRSNAAKRDSRGIRDLSCAALTSTRTTAVLGVGRARRELLLGQFNQVARLQVPSGLQRLGRREGPAGACTTRDGTTHQV